MNDVNKYIREQIVTAIGSIAPVYHEHNPNEDEDLFIILSQQTEEDRSNKARFGTRGSILIDIVHIDEGITYDTVDDVAGQVLDAILPAPGAMLGDAINVKRASSTNLTLPSAGRNVMRRLIRLEYTMIGGGQASSGGVGGMVNYTAVTYDTGVLTFTGGNDVGELELYQESFLGWTLVITLSAGQRTLNFALNAGTNVFKWRKKSGSTFTDYVQQDVMVVNAGPRSLRLYPVAGGEDYFTFPLGVASQRTTDGISWTYENIGTANNAEEYKTMWNADPDNAILGQISTYVYKVFTPLEYWAFTIVPNDYQPYPNFFRGYPI
jgi:hypothetical protein